MNDAPSAQILETFFRLLNDKGCSTSCCGIEAFHSGSEVLHMMAEILTHHREALTTWIKKAPKKNSSELVWSLSILADLRFLLTWEDAPPTPNLDELLILIDAEAKTREIELARVRHSRRTPQPR